MNVSVSVSVKVPLIAGGSGSRYFQMDYESKQGKTTKNQVVYILDFQVTIPAQKSVDILVQILEQEEVVDWTADIIVSGYFTVYYKELLGGRHLYVYPISLACSDPLVKIDLTSCVYKAEGTFTGVQSKTTIVSVSERSLNEISRVVTRRPSSNPSSGNELNGDEI
ncbi:hypothetical protein IscW_ISCW010943 [Ixodes scapularis]|uniref:Uncharacterized protein n=1 Tax=Ixodes scapularis TaxID=6945 RepID=B7Q6U6_IXOSC|nr:hypothetical protein IscW_ISCW010943 [Ixodes scapularis]|eukprot:XP_002403414.1 hypothetical protein IscW_ISCW010943 [Ixodes scapularis]